MTFKRIVADLLLDKVLSQDMPTNKPELFWVREFAIEMFTFTVVDSYMRM
jgi:hypothetical protein